MKDADSSPSRPESRPSNAEDGSHGGTRVALSETLAEEGGGHQRPARILAENSPSVMPPTHGIFRYDCCGDQRTLPTARCREPSP